MSPRKKKWTGQKGSYGDGELPIAKAYPRRQARNKMLLLGGILIAAALGVLILDQLFGRGALSSSGPLSSAHAAFGEDCANCHDPKLNRATDDRCQVCHEKYGDELGVYNFQAHYLYRSDDFRRLVPGDHEVSCSTCHIEHEGRDAEITQVADLRCASCHFRSFETEHPEFRFAAEEIADSAALSFAHVHHVREVMKRMELDDVEKSCLYCHNADPEGRGFQPISFDQHCDSCHLTATTSTPALPIANGEQPGVVTPEQIVAAQGPGIRWAYFTDPHEYRRRGSLLAKGPLHHRDPWLLENLRILRQELYPDAGIADLLDTSADVEPHQIRSLYSEAIATLEEHAIGLRGRPEPEIQAQLSSIETLLDDLKRALDKPFTALDETSFLLALERPNPALTEAQIEAIEGLAMELTTPCRQCHQVERATIARVQANQKILRRAEFNHRAHILQARCLDCHSDIPILGNFATTQKIPAVEDRAGIQNLPAISNCRQCHSSNLASERCVTCHLFHPNKSRRSELLLYLDEEPP